MINFNTLNTYEQSLLLNELEASKVASLDDERRLNLFCPLQDQTTKKNEFYNSLDLFDLEY